MTLSSSYFRGVETNPLKLKCPLSRHVKNKGMGAEKRRGKYFKIEMPSFFIALFLMVCQKKRRDAKHDLIEVKIRRYPTG